MTYVTAAPAMNHFRVTRVIGVTATLGAAIIGIGGTASAYETCDTYVAPSPIGTDYFLPYNYRCPAYVDYSTGPDSTSGSAIAFAPVGHMYPYVGSDASTSSEQTSANVYSTAGVGAVATGSPDAVSVRTTSPINGDPYVTVPLP